MKLWTTIKILIPHLYEAVPNSPRFGEHALSRSLGFLPTFQPPHYHVVIKSATN